MSFLAWAGNGLAWLGRQGTRAIAALVVLGIVAPPLGALLKPWVSEAVFLIMCTAFLRLEPDRLRGYLRRPLLILAATAWTMLAVPLGCGLAGGALGLSLGQPELYLALMLNALTSPMMATPALAALMGLDATLALITMVAGSALVPFTAPLFAHWFLGAGLAISPLALGGKLLVILAGSALVGLVLRRWAGAQAVARHREKIDGFNLLVLFVFVAAVMEKVAVSFWSAPWLSLGLTALVFGVFFALLAATALLFAWAGRERALALGLMAAQRNLGLMLAATGGALPGLTWLYIGLAQFPIYLSPHMLMPLARRLAARREDAPD